MIKENMTSNVRNAFIISVRNWRLTLSYRLLSPSGRSRDWDRLTELERIPDYSLDPYSSWLAAPEKLRPTRCPYDAEPHKHLRSLSPPKYRVPLRFFTPEESDLLNWVGGWAIGGVEEIAIGVGM